MHVYTYTHADVHAQTQQCFEVATVFCTLPVTQISSSYRINLQSKGAHQIAIMQETKVQIIVKIEDSLIKVKSIIKEIEELLSYHVVVKFSKLTD